MAVKFDPWDLVRLDHPRAAQHGAIEEIMRLNLQITDLMERYGLIKRVPPGFFNKQEDTQSYKDGYNQGYLDAMEEMGCVED